MIQVDITLTGDGMLKGLTASGHSTRGELGKNIACAAVTVLLRTAVQTIDLNKKIQMNGEAKFQGDLDFRILGVEAEQASWLSGVRDFLLKGISDIEREYPEECALSVHVEED